MRVFWMMAASMLALGLSAQGTRADDVDYVKKYELTKDWPGMCSYAETDKKDYTGKEITILTHAVPVMGEPVELHAKQFEELTGGTVKVIHAPFGELFQKVMIPFQAGQSVYDIVYGGSYWIGDWAQYLEPVPEKYLETDEMKDVLEAYKGVASWNGKRLQYTFDGDRHYFKYYLPPFENEDNKKKFKEKYGRDLAPPKTWEEYAEVATFFNDWDWMGDGKKHYGSVEIMKRDDLLFAALVTRFAAYAKNPSVKGGFWFDLETMTPQINNPGFVKGLQSMVDALKYSVPGSLNIGISDEIFSFGSGQALMSISWDDAFVQAQQPDSPIRNQVRAAPAMCEPEVWNRVTNKWDHFDPPSCAPFYAWGWGAGVSKFSKNKDMAFDWFCFKANFANTDHDIVIGRFGVNPFRKQHLEASYWHDRAGWDTAVAESFVSVLKSMDTSTNRVFDLRVPGVNQYYTAIVASAAKALAGQMTAQEALDEAAEEWKRITERIGVDKIRDAYKNVVAQEDNEPIK